MYAVRKFKAKRRLSWFWQEKKMVGLTCYLEIKTTNPEIWVHLPVYLLICFESINQILWS